MTHAWQPTIDVLIGTFNEEHHLQRALTATLGQDYPAELIRFWLLDGGSTDRTVAIGEAAARADRRLTVLAPGARLTLPEALNVGIERGEAELIAKIDAHGWPEADFLSRAVAAFREAGSEAGCVGGRPAQEGETPFGRALALARASRFGVGGSDYAGNKGRGWVDSVQCGVYRRAALADVGPFDPGMNYGEDDELNWRLLQGGHRIYLDTRIRFHYITRPSWSGAYRQYRNYGRARVGVVAKHSEFLRAHHLAPAAFVAGLGGLAALSLVSRHARLLLAGAAGSYALASGSAAIRTAGLTDPVQAARVASAFTALHAGYGVGMLQALRGGGARILAGALRR